MNYVYIYVLICRYENMLFTLYSVSLLSISSFSICLYEGYVMVSQGNNSLPISSA